jgi:predicted small lipoprotein YifL
MRPMRPLATLLFLTVLAACGQTGDLYLPRETPPASAQPEEPNKKKGQVPSPAEPDPAPAQQEVR